MVTSCFPPSVGGQERCVFELATRMKRLGHDVTTVTSSRGLPCRAYDSQSEQTGRVLRYPERFTFLEVPIVPQIPLRLLTDGNYDVVHIHGMTPTQTDLALLIAKTSDSRIVYTHHFDPQTRGGHLTQIYSLLGRTVVSLANVITASTASYAESSPILKHNLSKVAVVPMGVDSARFENVNTVVSLKDSTILESFDQRVLYVGKLIYYKGLQYLLKAFSNVKASGSCLVIVGQGHERPHLTRLAHEFGISDRVFFLGKQPDWKLPAIYAMSDMVVLPSITRREAFGIVLLEALASGKAVIASNIPGVSDVIRDGETGLLVPPSDSMALGQAIERLLEDKKASSRMGTAGRTIVKDRYNWDNITQSFLDLYA